MTTKEPNGMRMGLTGIHGGTGFETGDLKSSTFMCACGGLGASGELVSAFKGSE